MLTQRLDMGRGRPGSRQSAESLKLFGVTSIPNPMNMILQQQDSLELTRLQADSLALLSYKFALFTDSVWTPVSYALAALNIRRQIGLSGLRPGTRTDGRLSVLVPTAKGILSPSQRRKHPPQSRTTWTTGYCVFSDRLPPEITVPLCFANEGRAKWAQASR